MQFSCTDWVNLRSKEWICDPNMWIRTDLGFAGALTRGKMSHSQVQWLQDNSFNQLLQKIYAWLPLGIIMSSHLTLCEVCLCSQQIQCHWRTEDKQQKVKLLPVPRQSRLNLRSLFLRHIQGQGKIHFHKKCRISWIRQPITSSCAGVGNCHYPTPVSNTASLRVRHKSLIFTNCGQVTYSLRKHWAWVLEG